jgi:DNA-directed RNA polymerase specialized sigma24 family protein
VSDSDPQTTHSRQRWQLNREALEALLEALDPDRDRAGRTYEDLRRRLINLFAWEQCEVPEDLADEALNRVARKVTEGAVIPHFDRFAFGIARLIIQEEIRKQRNRLAAVGEIRTSRGQIVPDPTIPDWTALDSMRECLDALPAARRELIEHYYTGDRAALARKLELSLNALRNRAMRIRDELSRCISRRRDES